MKLSTFILKKRKILYVLAIFVAIFIAFATGFAVKFASTPKPTYTIVIDAGHGGQDGGAVGKQTGITESALNLEYSLYLKELFEQFGFKVVLTRSDMGGLYSPFASNKKRDEMEKRRRIIEKERPDFVLSIHMNSYPMQSCRGAQVFYGTENSTGQNLAQKVQASLNTNIEYAKKMAKEGDYYIINAVDVPSILIECGFLSNIEEEIILQQKTYIHDFCYSVVCGVLQYYNYL